MGPDPLLDPIYEAAWWVRHHWRPGQRRAQALRRLGLAVRRAFNASDDFEPLLYAVCHALSEIPDPRFAVTAEQTRPVHSAPGRPPARSSASG